LSIDGTYEIMEMEQWDKKTLTLRFVLRRQDIFVVTLPLSPGPLLEKHIVTPLHIAVKPVLLQKAHMPIF